MEEKQKSFAREVAIAMLLFVAGLTVAGIFMPETIAWEAAKFFAIPVITFTGAAFSLDKYLKQR